MAKQLFANNATGYLNATITDTATSIVLQSGNGAVFPSPTGGDYFFVTLYDGVSLIEIVKVTARSSDTLTVVRGQEGTTASAFPSASIVECRATKGTFENLAQKTGDSVTDLTVGTLTLTNDLSVANGGTGASTAGDARTNLGLGSIATQNSNSVTITGGSISGITDIAVADGGTGASTAADARTNLGLGTAATKDTGTAAGNVVVLDGSAKLPAVDGSQLTGIPAPAALSTASGSAPSYSARAWVNFNGTGTVAIRASGNVSSITDNGTGSYAINFTTAIEDANYSVVVTAEAITGGGATGYFLVKGASSQSASSVGITCLPGNVSYGGATDFVYCNAAIYR